MGTIAWRIAAEAIRTREGARPISDSFKRLVADRARWRDQRPRSSGERCWLLEAAQSRRRCANAPHLVALVRAGATFVDGLILEREDQRYAA